MKALLIVPNIKSFDAMPSVSVACLKGFINEKTSHDAKIIDFAFHKKDWKNYLTDQINEEKPDLIGFTVLSFNFPEALEIAQYIKEKFSIKIIFGGVHVILSPQGVIEKDEVDIVCTGEGEFVLKELLDRSLDCKNIKGIWYKQNGKIIKNNNRRLIENLDDLPFSDFKDFELTKYFTLNHNHLPIMASRGCPYNCTFCGNHALKEKLEGKYVRFRTVDRVIEEIELRVKQFYNNGFKYLYFFDDTFILNKNFINEFCKKFKKKGFHRNIKWTSNVRANLVTDDIIKTMKGAGCYEVRMGVESGNDFIRNNVYNRKMTNEQLVNAFKIIKKYNMELRLDFIIGAPYETIDMMNESFNLAKQSGADQVFFSRLYPFPGTIIRDICKKEQMIEENVLQDNIGMPPIDRTRFVTKKQIQRLFRKINWWQGQKYFDTGFKLKDVRFLLDIMLFLIYYKHKYELEMNQIYRWNIQKYKLSNL